MLKWQYINLIIILFMLYRRTIYIWQFYFLIIHIFLFIFNLLERCFFFKFFFPKLTFLKILSFVEIINRLITRTISILEFLILSYFKLSLSRSLRSYISCRSCSEFRLRNINILKVTNLLLFIFALTILVTDLT